MRSCQRPSKIARWVAWNPACRHGIAKNLTTNTQESVCSLPCSSFLHFDKRLENIRRLDFRNWLLPKPRKNVLLQTNQDRSIVPRDSLVGSPRVPLLCDPFEGLGSEDLLFAFNLFFPGIINLHHSTKSSRIFSLAQKRPEPIGLFSCSFQRNSWVPTSDGELLFFTTHSVTENPALGPFRSNKQAEPFPVGDDVRPILGLCIGEHQGSLWCGKLRHFTYPPSPEIKPFAYFKEKVQKKDAYSSDATESPRTSADGERNKKGREPLFYWASRPLPNLLELRFYGGGGNRTPVQRKSHASFYTLSRQFDLVPTAA